MARTIFIAGTDTNVGKTLVAALVALRLVQNGARVVTTKPIASGCEMRDGILVSEDAEFLLRATQCKESLDTINPIRWAEPLAPLVCARRANASSSDAISATAAMIRDLGARYETVVVEGVGGVLAPVGESESGEIWTNLELAAMCDETILVARRTLGTVNHTTLTARSLEEFGLKVRGLIFCDAAPVEEENIAAQTSPALCAEMTGLPILGEIPFMPSRDEASLQSAAALLSL